MPKTIPMPKSTVKVWNTCGYVRLSREDGDKEESNSVRGQKELIRDFLRRTPDLQECGMKVDDGYTGSNFDRPAFQEMIADIKAGKINCVVVKDLSRFGRDHLEAGEYIEKIFPFLGVRFIAINDHYDSLHRNPESDELIVPFKNLVNEAYCRDISIKTRSHLDIKRRHGDFIGAFPTYGYKKDPEDHNRLLIDEEAAGVVRDIFRWKMDGVSAQDIADRLNAAGIATPMDYKTAQGMRYQTQFRKKKESGWCAKTVLRILKNPIYIGTLEQGRVTTPTYRVKRQVNRPRSEWAVVENNHDAIIDPMDFQVMQQVLALDTRTSVGGTAVEFFSGLLFCGECGASMVRKTTPSGNKKYVYYVCSAHKRDRTCCSAHQLRDTALNEIVLESLKQHIRNVIDLSDLLEMADTAQLRQASMQKLHMRLERKNQEIARAQMLLQSLYENLADGIIDREDYKDLKAKYTRRRKEAEEQAEAIREEMSQELAGSSENRAWIEMFRRHQNITELERNAVVSMIERIMLYEGHRVEIVFRWQNEYQWLVNVVAQQAHAGQGWADMARTKRKVNYVQPVAAEPPTPQSRIYRAGGYIRLSVEDSGNPGADTIYAQRELVVQYIEAQTDMTYCGIYCDNGRTGTNFERPEFERLMADIRNGRIDCIVVKDLSRFGRNYLETGNYLERIFPFLDVRFVAINDNFDTLTAERSTDGYIIPLKNIINGAYSKDISRKSSSALATKQRKGEFIGSFAPYGYQKSVADNHKLEPNPETTPVVQMMFQWRASGLSYLKIARKLNEMGILSPSRYHYQRGEVKAERFANAIWHVPVVKKILSSEAYLGHMVQGRNYNDLSMGKKMCKRPQAEWVVVPDTHEPIIDTDTFRIVQEMAEKCRATYRNRAGRFDDLGTVPNILRGLVFCADCKKPMGRYKNVSERCGHRYYSYICLTHAENPSACPKKNLHETKLLEILWDALQREIAMAANVKKLVEKRSQSSEVAKRENTLKQEIDAANAALERAEMLYDSLYQNYVDHLMSEEEYTELQRRYKQDIESAKARLSAAEQQKRAEQRKVSENPWLITCEQFACEAELTEEMAHALIKRVEIDSGDKISVALRFRDEYAALVRLLGKDAEAVSA